MTEILISNNVCDRPFDSDNDAPYNNYNGDTPSFKISIFLCTVSMSFFTARRTKLVCVDRSEESEQALKYAFDTSSPADLLYVVHSEHAPFYMQSSRGHDSASMREIRTHYERLCENAGVWMKMNT